MAVQEGILIDEGHGLITRQAVAELDEKDPLSSFRDLFNIPDLIYLDGNSLGCLPKATMPRIKKAVEEEWGEGLISSWNKHDWISLPQKIGADISTVIGARPEEVIVADSTSVNIFKTVSAALDLRPDRHIIISERTNFPTDLYILEGLIEVRGSKHKLVLVDDASEITKGTASLEDVAVVLLTHVSYCTGRMLDMVAITEAVSKGGALMVWDLAHSAGAVPVDLNKAKADFAVGCGYKYLNGGPGAPAYLFVAKRHQAAAKTPLRGWMGHKNGFAFQSTYLAADNIDRFLCGTAPILSCISLQVGVETSLKADIKEVRRKSKALGVLFQRLISQECASYGFRLLSPEDAELRGSQINYCHEHGYAITQALIAKGVVGDFRSPDILRFGFTPLYTTYMDVWNAVQQLKAVMENKEWAHEQYNLRNKVT